MKNRTTVAICAIFALTLFITGINSVKATSAYDGSYNIVMSGMTVNPATNQVEEVHASSTYFGVEGFLIITNGHISNVYVESLYNPSLPPGVELVGPAWVTWDGTVDDQGNAQWTGGSFVANTGLSYTFIGKINSDGTGSGTWDRPGEAHGTWILTKTFVSNQNVGGVVGFFNQILAGIHQILGGIGVIAGFFPARRAASVDPVESLRYE